MNSSRALGWVSWTGVAGLEVAEAGTPPPTCLFCSFCSRRAFLSSLAFLHNGLPGSAPTPEGEERDGEEWDGEQEKNGKRKRGWEGERENKYYC